MNTQLILYGPAMQNEIFKSCFLFL